MALLRPSMFDGVTEEPRPSPTLQKSSRELRQLLEPLVIDRPALTHGVRKTRATWVRPELSAAIQYRAITSDGLLRHASFKRLHQPMDARRRSKPRGR